MKYGTILSKAWQILRNNKQLWPFGLIASGFSGIAVLVPFTQRDLIRSISNQSNPDQFLVSVLTYMFTLLVFSLINFLISLFGTIALIQGILDIQAKRKATFKSLAKRSLQVYGRALKLNVVITTLPLLVPVALFTLGGLLAFITGGLALLCLVPLFFLIIPAAFLYFTYLEVANVALISEDMDYRTAIRTSWKFFKHNWGSLAILALILAIANALTGTAINFPVSFAYYPTDVSNPIANFNAWVLIFFISVNTVFYSAVHIFNLSAWTLAYAQLNAPKRKTLVSKRRK